MHCRNASLFIALAAFSVAINAQQTSQVQLNIGPSNRTLTVSAQERVTVEPEVAILHVGFETQPSDAKTAYANGAKTSKQVMEALKQAGIAESAIRSDDQYISSIDAKARKYKLIQNWTVEAPPGRAAEILDIAVGAGATESGQIEWTVKNVKALEAEAITQAAARARSDAQGLAKGMGVNLGSLIYVSHEVTTAIPIEWNAAKFSAGVAREASPVVSPLAINPRKVSRTATVYAVFSIDQ